MKHRLLWPLGAFSALLAFPAQADLRISEFLARNLGGLEDEQLSTPDWIEIENTGTSDVDLGGYFLTNEAEDLDKWEFPSGLKVKSKSRIVVFASGKDQHTALTIFQASNPIKPTHTDFRLQTDSGYLALISPDRETVIHDYGETYPRQIANISYGIDENGELGYFKESTPGAPNGPSVPTGPFVVEVVNLTGQPEIGVDETISITATVVENEFPVASVNLFHRFMFGSESRTEMKDDGVAPDETEGDGIYTASFNLASIFGSQIDPGEMVRWRVEAEDEQGNTMRDPLFHDEDNADEYYGTVAVDPSIETSNLDVLHWFIERPTSANNDRGSQASVFFLGEFYDNINVNIHGQSTRGFPKKSWDFSFNSHNRFKHQEDQPRVKGINMLTNWADKAKVRNTMAYEMYRMGGVKAHWARTIRIQQNGAFLGTWDMVENGDVEYIENVGLDANGALYKMYNRLDAIGSADPFAANGAEKKSRRYENKDDVEELIDGIGRGSTSEKIDYIYDNVDIPSTVNFLVMNSVVNNTDYGHKNYYVYRDTEGTGEWRQLPWDVDLSLGRRWIGSHNYFFDPIQTSHSGIEDHVHGNRMATLFMSNSTLNDMIYRRLRTMYDYFYGPPGGEPKSDYMLRRLDELVELIDPEGVVSDADLDYEVGLRDMEAKFNQANGWDNKDTMREAVARMRDEYIPGRRDYVYGLRKLPNEQKPISDFKLSIAEVDYAPESGNHLEEYIVLKNQTGELVDLSNFRFAGAIEHTIRPGTILASGSIFDPDLGNLYIVRDAKAFRARSTSPKGGERLFVQGNYNGQLSSRGEVIQLLDPEGNVILEHSYEGDPSVAQQSLRITELLFNPLAPEEGEEFAGRDFEFVELTNAGEEPLDLSGVAFTDGIRYTFAEGTILQPGAVALLVNDVAAFESRFGTDLPVFGEYVANLSNGGERLEVRDAAGESIISFSYDPEWHEATSEGHSLELLAPNAAVDPLDFLDQLELPESWRASEAVNGTPGTIGGAGPVDPQPGGMTYASWSAAHFSAAELADPAISAPEADANGDGVVNLLAYAFHFGPREQPQLPQVEVTPEDVSVSFIQHTDADDLIYRVEMSEDLEAWSEAGEMDPDPTPVEGNAQRVTIKTAPQENARANYLRVAVELKP